MTITEFLKTIRGCRHEKVKIESCGSYCPDCGEYITIKWYLVRCSCCGVKRSALLDFNDNVKAADKYCPNCGSIHTVVEEIEKINFVDINFAVHKKEITEQRVRYSATQIWTDNEDKKEQALICAKKI